MRLQKCFNPVLIPYPFDIMLTRAGQLYMLMTNRIFTASQFFSVSLVLSILL